ncbi:MAG TPA: aminotransferase class III-fold pyridoxal phosphate-dependent enzyme [Vicinamibacterales bacterium]|jgi:glutamate-1-semialdehyde 2,1-aminomutase
MPTDMNRHASTADVQKGQPAPRPDGLQTAVTAATTRFRAANPKSLAQHAAATAVMPGGNTRTVLYHDPFPLTIARGEGCRLWDLDGHEYLDMLGEFTAGIFGHTNDVIRSAVTSALERGIDLSGHTVTEAELARLICDRFPSIELVRFTNSGTEANLMALAAATAFTVRRKILVFQGGYHGAVLGFARGRSASNVPHDFIVSTYNDVAGATRLIESHGDQLAAILVEPMLGSAGCIPGNRLFLEALRRASSASGAVLIFDEVMTSRLSAGGLQQALGIVPDLTTLGKYLGGGFSFGAFGGRREIMEQFDPRRPNALPHAGTFNNNIVTMSAGVAGLRKVLTPAAVEALNARGDALRERLNAVCRGRRLQFTGIGSLMCAHPVDGAVQTAADTAGAEPLLRDLLYFDLLERGFYLARRGFIALSLALGDDEIRRFEEAVADVLQQRGEFDRPSAP